MRKRGEKTKSSQYDVMYGNALMYLRCTMFTQSQMAEKLNITKEMYSSYERGLAKISIAMEGKIADIFKFSSRSAFVKKIEEVQEVLNIK